MATLAQVFESCPTLDCVTGKMLPLGPETLGTYAVSSRRSPVRQEFRNKTTPWHIGTGGNTAVKREWFDRIGYYDERLGTGSAGKAAEDAEFHYRLLRAAGIIRYEPNAIVYHERQSKAQMLARRVSYGHGIGAFCGMRLRAGDMYAARILGDWLSSLGREMAGYAVRRRTFEVQKRVLGLRGTARGLRYGLGLPIEKSNE